MPVLLKIFLQPSEYPETNKTTYSPDWRSLQRKITWYDSLNKKHTFYPSEIKEFGFTYKNEKYIFLSRKYDLKMCLEDSCVFLKLEVNGYLKLFNTVQLIRNGPMPCTGTLVDRYVIQKGEEPLFALTPFLFKTDTPLFFIECPELADKIRNREYKIEDAKAIANYYNQWWAEQIGKTK